MQIGWMNANAITRSPKLQGAILLGWLDGSLCNFISFIGLVTTELGYHGTSPGIVYFSAALLICQYWFPILQRIPQLLSCRLPLQLGAPEGSAITRYDAFA
jgi:hypothetical protein